MLLIPILIFVSFTGCADETPVEIPTVAVSIILGRHANANAFPDDYYDNIRDVIGKAVYGGHISVIVGDGQPNRINDLHGEINKHRERTIDFTRVANTRTRQSELIKSRTDAVIDFLKNDSIRAVHNENDLLKAIREARNSMNSVGVKEAEEKNIVILDNGISTIGDFEMQKLGLDTAEPPTVEDVVNNLLSQEVLPDLTGINVTFIGLGDVAFPQVLSTHSRVFLSNLWTAIFKECGAESIEILELATGSIANLSMRDGDDDVVNDRFPFVTAVRFEPLVFSIVEGEDGHPIILIDGKDPVISTDVIGFKPDEAVYLDEEQSKKSLDIYSKFLEEFVKEYPHENIYIVGSVALTSKCPPEGDVNLSLKRAEKVIETLTDLLPDIHNNLFPYGIGSNVPWIQGKDLNSDGTQIESTAQQKRSVWILLESSERYKQIITQ